MARSPRQEPTKDIALKRRTKASWVRWVVKNKRARTLHQRFLVRLALGQKDEAVLN